MALENAYGMGKDEKSKTRPGEEDYTGHTGDESETHPGEEDYEAHKGSESKTHEGKDYTRESLADHLATDARDGAHLLELLEEAGWEITPPAETGLEEVLEEGLGGEGIAIPIGPPPEANPHLDLVSMRLDASKKALDKDKLKGKKRG